MYGERSRLDSGNPKSIILPFGQLALRCDSHRVRDRHAEEREILRRPGASTAMALQIKAARIARELTLAELAAIVELDKGYLSKVERGLKVPSIATLLKLATTLSCRCRIVRRQRG